MVAVEGSDVDPSVEVVAVAAGAVGGGAGTPDRRGPGGDRSAGGGLAARAASECGDAGERGLLEEDLGVVGIGDAILLPPHDGQARYDGVSSAQSA